jgi:hypothetical protein
MKIKMDYIACKFVNVCKCYVYKNCDAITWIYEENTRNWNENNGDQMFNGWGKGLNVDRWLTKKNGR